MDIRKNPTLFLALIVPLLMVVAVAVVIYLPTFIHHPQGSFLYSVGDNYYSQQYLVENGKLVKNDVAVQVPDGATAKPIGSPAAQLFTYNIATDQVEQVSYEQAQSYALNGNVTSPDGYTVINTYGNSGIVPLFFSAHDTGGYYLKGHGISKKLAISTDTAYFGSFKFLGWIN